jgi:DNA repair exonuclease SbcCD nuclease subunit
MRTAAAARRRTEVWQTFCRSLELARDREVDLVTVGGDLWEEEHVKPDTRRSVLHALAEVEVPVLVIAGNHDPLISGGNWYRAIPELPDNVALVQAASLERHEFGDVVLWGASWMGGVGGDLSPEVIRSATVDSSQRNILLIHGTLMNTLFADDSSYCPFSEQDVSEAGFDLCLAGHIHAAQQAGRVVYPGSIEPLTSAETGRHCVAVVDADATRLDVELVDVARFRYVDVVVPCDGATSSAQVQSLLNNALAGLDGHTYVRAHLSGAVPASVSLDLEGLRSRAEDTLADLVVVDETHADWDLERLAAEPTIRGLYVKKLLDRLAKTSLDEQAPIELAIDLGLRAFDPEAAVLREV